MKSDNGSLIAQRTIQLLLLFLEYDKLTLSEISKLLDISNPSTYRIVSTLVDQEFLIKDSTKRYRLSPIFIKFAKRIEHDLRSVALPIMKELSDQTGESVYLSIPHSETSYVFIEGVESSQQLKWTVDIAKPMPANAGAVGKAHLAFQNPNKTKQLVEEIEFINYTDNTIGDKETLLEELERIKKQGYSFSIGERYPEVVGLSAPIFDYTGRNCEAILSIFTPRYRYTEGDEYHFIDKLTKATQNITARLY